MKIVVFSRSTPFHVKGGMEAIAFDIVSGLAAGGTDVLWITSPFGKPPERIPANIRFLAARNGNALGYSASWWTSAQKVYDEAAVNDPHAIFSVSSAADLIRPRPSCRLFVHQSHGTQLTGIRSKLQTGGLKKTLGIAKNVVLFVPDLIGYRKSDWIVCAGPTVAQSFASFPYRLLVDRKKVLMIENGVSNLRFARRRGDGHGRLAGRARLAYIGRVSREKGIHHAIAAFHRLAETEKTLELHIVGEGPDRDRLERLAAQGAGRGSIVFHGPRERDEVAAFLPTCAVTLALHTCIEVGVSLNILESIAAGVPVIASPFISFDESVRGVRRLKSLETDEIVAAIREVLAVPVETALPERYRLERCVAEYEELLASTSTSAS